MKAEQNERAESPEKNEKFLSFNSGVKFIWLRIIELAEVFDGKSELKWASLNSYDARILGSRL